MGGRDAAAAYFPGLTTIEAFIGVGIAKRKNMVLIRPITDEAMDMRLGIIGGMMWVMIDMGENRYRTNCYQAGDHHQQA